MGLSDSEKSAFSLHLFYSLLDGFALGVLALNEFVFIKSLKGSNYQLGFLFQFGIVVFCFLIVFNEILKRVHNKKKLLKITALVTRGPLLLLLFFPSSAEKMAHPEFWHALFLVLFFIYFSAYPVIVPLINVLLKNSYRHQVFGSLYSISQMANKIVMLVVTFLYGLLLDMDGFCFVWVLPLVGLGGILSLWFLSRIEYTSPVMKKIQGGFWNSVGRSVKGMVTILRQNKPYLHFEIGFMIYGFAFMISVTIITIYFYKALNLNYSSVAFYKNIYNLLAIVLLPFFGRLIGKRDPRKFAVYTYASIMLFIVCLAFTQYFPAKFNIFGITVYYWLLPYLLFQGIYAATMVLLWNIGSAYFCSSNEVNDYQAVHMSLTGIRALFAPTSGVVIYELFGFMATFAAAIGTLVVAIAIMYWSYRKYPKIEVFS